jgi:glutamate-1-semialdehyde aminotransferase
VEDSDVGGIGGTLAGNALSIAAMKATLQNVLTDEFYAKAIALQEQFTEGVKASSKNSTCHGSSNAWAIAPNTGSVPTRRRMEGKPRRH